MWWVLAASQGHQFAKLKIAKNKEKVSDEKIHEAEILAKEWKPVP
jgi:hypothetical protein